MKPIYEIVIERLEARKGEWPKISENTGIPYSTLCKIAQGHIPNPSVHTVQTLYDYLYNAATERRQSRGRRATDLPEHPA